MRFPNVRVLLVASLALLCAGAAALSPAPSQPKPSLEQLKRQADAVLQQDAPLARANVNVVFTAADALADAGRLVEADHYYLAELKMQPHDFGHHLRYSQVLAKENKDAEAKNQAQIVLNGCEDLALVNKAMALAGVQPIQVTPYDDKAVRPDAILLVLVPLGDVDLLMLQQEQKKLHEELGIDVQIHSLPFTMGKPARNLMHDNAESLREYWQRVNEKEDPRAFSEMLKAEGATADDLKDDLKIIRFTARVMHRMSDEDKAAQIEQMAAADQWSAEDMIKDFAAIIPTTASPRVRFMGVTSDDIFEKGTRFLFAYYMTDKCAVISYHRFLASTWGDVPNRMRLSRRFHYQCLADAGYVYGLPRCTDPTCPRCYPNGLEEQDAKSDKLCDDCRRGFEKAFAPATLPKNPQD